MLGVRFDLISFDVVLETIERWRQHYKRHYIAITNPNSVMMCSHDTKMRKATEMASMILPDGVGIVLAASLLGYPHHGRVAGPILMLKLCEWGRQYGYRHYFYGGAEGVADKLAERISEMYPGLEVAGTYCPPFRPLLEEEDNRIVEKINSTKPDIVWVGLGAPKQEIWMSEHIGRLTATAMIGVGAAFDYHSGNARWAPYWIQEHGLEWFHGLIYRPRRAAHKLWGTFLFAVKVSGFCIKRKSNKWL
ncbi:MAG: hypothetical protein A2167_00320 [Planctomycetes bacterium RBG_13_46_10]|nr:MAG: hypothetical protein A2167_00320 [Planctomycetes bacterium RBG_13_46_10]